MSACGRLQTLVKPTLVEVPVAKLIPLDAALTAPINPEPMPAPRCVDAATKQPVSCVDQLVGYVEDELWPTIWEFQCRLALIRCTQLAIDAKTPAEAQSATIACVVATRARDCATRRKPED